MIGTAKTGTKIIDGLAPALLFTALLAGAGVISARLVTSRLEDVAKDKFPSALSLGGIVQDQARVARGINALLLPQMTDRAVRASIYAEMERNRREIADAMKAYEALPQSEAALRLWGRVRDEHRAWDAAAMRAIALLHERDGLVEKGSTGAQLASLDRKLWAAYLAARGQFAPLGEAVQAVVDVTKQDVELGRRAAQNAALAAIFCLLGAVVLGLGLVLGAGGHLMAAIRRRAEAGAPRLAGARAAGRHMRRRADGVYQIMRPVSIPLRNLVIVAGTVLAAGSLAYLFAGRATIHHLIGAAIPFVAIALLEVAMDGRRRRAPQEARVLQLH